MRIENDVKLDYNNVLIRPKRSTLGSRKEVDLNRSFAFRNSLNNYTGIPIIAANMDGVGTEEVALTLAKNDIFTCLAKSYHVEDIVEFFKPYDPQRSENVAMSIGITDLDAEKFEAVYAQLGTILKYVCIDVANGYSERFSNFVRKFRKQHPYITIIAGNVVTGEMTEELILNGADIVKVGVGLGFACLLVLKLVWVIRNVPQLSNVPMRLTVLVVRSLLTGDVLLLVMQQKHLVLELIL